jgi:hypothetical protein
MTPGNLFRPGIAVESLGIPTPGETALIAAALYAGTTHPLNITAMTPTWPVYGRTCRVSCPSMRYSASWGVVKNDWDVPASKLSM